MEGDYREQDRRFAEWYVWAKREVGTDARVCLGAAQAAMEALDEGADEQAARQAARGSVAGHGIALVSRIAPRRRAYAEWYDWARREIGGQRDQLHVAAVTALDRLDAGGDVAAAASAARTAVGQGPAAAPPPPPPAAQYGPPPQVGGAPAMRDAGTGALTAVHPAPYPPYAAVRPLPPEPPAHAYAGFWRRGAAWLIDTVLLAIGLTVVWLFLSLFALFGLLSSGQDITDSNFTGVQLAVLVIAFVLAWLYYAGLESSGWQGTIGKRLIRVVVTDLYGGRIGFGRASGRYFGKVVSALILFVGYVMAAFTERKQALHDLMAGTLVVRQEHLALITAPPRPAEPQSQPGGVQQGAS